MTAQSLLCLATMSLLREVQGAVADVFQHAILMYMKKIKCLIKNFWRFSMKRLCMTIAFAGMMTLPLASMGVAGDQKSDQSLCVQAHKGSEVQEGVGASEAPVCDVNAIAQYEITIKKDEYRNTLMRAGVYVCAFAGISYLGYRLFFSHGQDSSTPANKEAALTGPENVVFREMKEVYKKNQEIPFFSFASAKRISLSIRDMVLQTTGAACIYGIGNYLNKQLFYGKRINEFLMRSTNLVRMRADIEGYAAMLEESERGSCCRSEIQALLQDRTRRLCQDVERIVAYMHIVRDSVDTPSKDAFVVAEQFLVARTNAALASLWQSSTNTDKKSSDLARAIALTLHMFVQDFGQAVERFDAAYYLAVYAA